jgi:6-phosphofructokinase 1
MKIARNNKKIKSIAVLTSGGDAPGMNAALRAVTRAGISAGLKIWGVQKGYSGLLDSQFVPLELASVANIIQRGGTVLKTDRCPEFLKISGRRKAVANLRSRGIDGLVVIGGDGSFRGAHALWREHAFPVVGVPGTIDNDIFGTESTIGFDTATNTAVEAIDRIRDTASSHDRIFIVEVMGRNSGHLALEVGIAGGAEAVLIPEHPLRAREVAKRIERGLRRGKTSSIIIVAEGKKSGRSYELADALVKDFSLDSKVCILGHIQRGGAPSARDRTLASLLGAAAVTALCGGYSDLMVGMSQETAVYIPLKAATEKKKKPRLESLRLAEKLAT